MATLFFATSLFPPNPRNPLFRNPNPNPKPLRSLFFPQNPNPNPNPRLHPLSAAPISDEWGEKSDPDPESASEPDPPSDEITDEWGDKSASVPEADPKPMPDPVDDRVGYLKRMLADTAYGTDYGFTSSAEVRAEVSELVSQLEAANPTPAPTEAAAKLDGKWVLLAAWTLHFHQHTSAGNLPDGHEYGYGPPKYEDAIFKKLIEPVSDTYPCPTLNESEYTAFSELLPILVLGSTPLVKVKQISQAIDTKTMTIVNATTLSTPLATLSFSATASFEVRSPSRIQVKFKEGAFQPPEISTTADLPENLDIFGQKIDLSPVRRSLTPLQDAVANIARIISGQPPLKVPFPGNRGKSWLLTTYLDEDFRISRGDGGLFILAKEGNPLLN